MSESTTTAPPAEATGTDPVIRSPSPPPESASNDKRDHDGGISAEMSAIAAGELAAAKREPAAKETKPAAPAEPAEPKEPAAEPAEGEHGKEAKPDNTPPGVKAEITRERNRRRAAEEAQQAAQKRLDEALEAIKALTPKPPPEPVTEPRPRREEFGDPASYDTALEVWAARAVERARAEAREAATRETKEQLQQAQAKAEQDALVSTWAERRQKAMEQLPDYEAVAERDDVQITPPMAEAIMRSDNGAEVAYHLGKNPDEAARIAKLPSIGMQLFEMGKLAATLAKPAAPAVSRAPAPIVPLTGAREIATTSGREESMSEVAQRVAQREAAARRSTFGRV